MSKMNKAERQYHQHLLKTMDTKEVKVQRRIDFCPEVGVQWDMDFIMKDLMVDVKGVTRAVTKMKADLWKVFGDRPLKIVRVLPNTGRPQTLRTVNPDIVAIDALIARLQRNKEKLLGR